VNTKTGGANGSIRYEEEYTHGSNAGLKIAIDILGMHCLYSILTGCLCKSIIIISTYKLSMIYLNEDFEEINLHLFSSFFLINWNSFSVAVGFLLSSRSDNKILDFHVNYSGMIN